MTATSPRHPRDDGEVVADEQQRHAARGDQPSSSASTSAWTVTSSAVVGSSAISSVGRAGQGHRDRDALALAAGDLVRVGAGRCAPGPAGRPRRSSCDGRGPQRRARASPRCRRSGSAICLPEPHQRVRAPSAAPGRRPPARRRAAAASARSDAPIRSCPSSRTLPVARGGRPATARSRRARSATSPTGLADQPEPVTRAGRVERRRPSTSARPSKRTVEVLDPSGQRHRTAPRRPARRRRRGRSPGRPRRAAPSASRLKPSTSDDEGHAGPRRTDRGCTVTYCALLEHPAPGRRRRRRAEAEVGQAASARTASAEQEGELHNQDGPDVRQDVRGGRSAVPTPGRAGGGHVVGPEHAIASRPGEAGDVRRHRRARSRRPRSRREPPYTAARTIASSRVGNAIRMSSRCRDGVVEPATGEAGEQRRAPTPTHGGEGDRARPPTTTAIRAPDEQLAEQVAAAACRCRAGARRTAAAPSRPPVVVQRGSNGVQTSDTSATATTSADQHERRRAPVGSAQQALSAVIEAPAGAGRSGAGPTSTRKPIDQHRDGARSSTSPWTFTR